MENMYFRDTFIWLLEALVLNKTVLTLNNRVPSN